MRLGRLRARFNAKGKGNTSEDELGQMSDEYEDGYRAGVELTRMVMQAEIDRLREALRDMLSTAEVDQLENLSICDVGSDRAKMKNRAVASRCGMLLGKLHKIARAALGEGKE